MKKTVRHLIGSAGITPVIGLMVPAAAVATAADGTAQAPAATAKTVSLTHMGAAGAAQASTPCIGSNRHHKTAGARQVTFWSAPLGNPVSFDCIGTVVGRWSRWPNERGWKMRVRIYQGPAHHFVYHALIGCGKVDFQTIRCIDGIHRYFKDPVQVCLAWRKVYSSGISITRPICLTTNR